MDMNRELLRQIKYMVEEMRKINKSLDKLVESKNTYSPIFGGCCEDTRTFEGNPYGCRIIK